METAESGPRVHQEVEQDPAGGVLDLLEREHCAVGLVDRIHQLLGHPREALGSTEVVVYDSRGGACVGDNDVVLGRAGDAQGLALVVVEGQTDAGRVGQVGRDVALGQLDQTVLDILGVHELDLVEHLQLLQQRGTNQAVEITAGNKTALLNGLRGHALDPLERCLIPRSPPRRGI